VRVCLLKIEPERGKEEKNYDRLAAILERTRGLGADVFVTPECYLDGYIAADPAIGRTELLSHALVPEQSPYVRRLREFCKESGAWLVFGCTEATEEGPRNAALIMNRTGALAETYHKVHLQSHDRKFLPGRALPVHQSDFGAFGVMICADRRWPETVRTLALKGARIIFAPSYGMHGEANERMMRTRSYESEVFICFTHPVESLVTNPRGESEARLESSCDGYLLHDIDLNAVDSLREAEASHLKDRVPDAYA
jgi:omega-amidase